MRLGIRTKIILIPAVILLIAFAVGASVISEKLRADTAASLREVARFRADTLRFQLERLIQLDMKVRDIEGFEVQCREAQIGTELAAAWVMDRSGEILFHNGADLNIDSASEPMTQGGHRHEMTIETVNGEKLRVTLAPVTTSGEVVAWVATAFPQRLLDEKVASIRWVSALVTLTSLVVTIVILWTTLTFFVIRPISRLLRAIKSVKQSGSVGQSIEGLNTRDEIGEVAVAFNGMLDGIRVRDARISNHMSELAETNSTLETRVMERTTDLVQANKELQDEVFRRREAELRKEQIHSQLIETSRKAGMADVATGVLHNVGNVLNSANVAADLLIEHNRRTPLPHLQRLVEMITKLDKGLADYLTNDPRGQQFVPFLVKLSEQFEADHRIRGEELKSLSMSIAHMKEIVAMQQSLAVLAGVVSDLKVRDIVADAIKINEAGLGRHGVVIQHVEEPADLRVRTDGHKVLQILINLVSNAKYAVSETVDRERRVTVRSRQLGNGGVEISVEDTGHGIDPEHMSRMFQFGFTTKKGGHGFGLHTSALAAKEIGGELTFSSEGIGKGATFILTLPAVPPQEMGEVKNAA